MITLALTLVALAAYFWWHSVKKDYMKDFAQGALFATISALVCLVVYAVAGLR